jgi:hypothetical protein
LQSRICMVIRNVFCHQDETIKHLFFQYRPARSIWSIIQLALALYPPCSVANIFGNWLHDIDHRFRMHIKEGAIGAIWMLWLCRMIKCLMIKALLCCMFFTDVPILSVYGLFYNVRRVEICLWRSFHG